MIVAVMSCFLCSQFSSEFQVQLKILTVNYKCESKMFQIITNIFKPYGIMEQFDNNLGGFCIDMFMVYWIKAL